MLHQNTLEHLRVKLGTDVFDLVGDTPLVSLRRIAEHVQPVQVYAKAEWFNPSGSVKDRPAREIILAAERAGKLTPHKILLDATSGNMGIAYAMLCAARGYQAKLVIPENASPERIKILRAYHADLVFSNALEGADGAIRRAREIVAANPGQYFYADQYSNPANWQAHYNTTGVEVWEQTHGEITHFVAGLGTSGTFIGTGRRLRELNPNVQLIAAQPDAPFHGLEGLKHYQTAIVPAIYDASLADAQVTVSTEEAHAMVKRLAREEGLFVGVSAGAAAVAAIQVAEKLREGVVVTVFPDAGFKYLSDRFWEEK
ncbi:MAG: cysteine synthase family protein [Chloroflexi bacterium]|nr:cysteine synthase family protein [Chloroflexota bacterium]